jgi:5-methyltetrahydrofolate--homocysteine methyltransferase
MPNRPLLNATFVAMAIAAGMPCAITNPLEHEIRNAIYAADVLMGHDPDMNYLMAMRKLEKEKQAASGQPTTAVVNAADDRRAAREARRAARENR